MLFSPVLNLNQRVRFSSLLSKLIASSTGMLAAERPNVVLPPQLRRQMMAYYRLYVRNGSADGGIVAFEEIDAADDNEAMRLATRHQDKFLELWQQARRVASFEPDRSQA